MSFQPINLLSLLQLGELKTKDRSLSILKKEIACHKKLNSRDGLSGTNKHTSNGTLVSSQVSQPFIQ